MIKIIAVHPEVMSAPDGIREYLKDFGSSKGRWIPLVPHNWKSIVSQAIKRAPGLGTIERNSLRDKIMHPKFAERYLRIEAVENDSRDWEGIVEEYCGKGLFDAAITSGGKPSNGKFLVAKEFDPDCDLYAVKTSEFIARDPEELCRHIIPMLRFAAELHVIDVYCLSICTNSASYARFFQGLLKWTRVNNRGLNAITIHRRLPDGYDRSRETANYRSWLLPILEPGEEVRVRYLQERANGDSMHLRAVFSDRLLVTGHYGFGKGTSPGETTDLTLRENVDFIKIREDYLDDKKIGFNLVDEVLIRR